MTLPDFRELEAQRSTSVALTRRDALKLLAGALALPALARGASAAENKSIWKTAIGLNGFQSGSRKYKKKSPIPATPALNASR